MNDIRINKDEEKVLIEAKFKLSPAAIIVFVVGLLIFGVPLGVFIAAGPTATGEINGEPASGWVVVMPFIIIFGFLFLIFFIVQMLKLIGIKRSEFVVTNKRIYGKRSRLIINKTFSYRLDEIDNVEMVSTLGLHTLAIQFTQGHGPTHTATTYVNGIPTSLGYNVLRMSNIKNYREVYEVMNEQIVSKKNLVDVQTDIEMGKLNAENRKAEALEHVASNIGGGNASSEASKTTYLDELRELKKLLDEGIITKEEFEQEKSEILRSNHK